MKKATRRSINKLLKSQIMTIHDQGDIHQFRILRMREGLRWDHHSSQYVTSKESISVDIECYTVNADSPRIVYTSSKYKSHQTNRWIRWSLNRKSSVLRSTVSMMSGYNCKDVEIKSIKRSPVSLGEVNYSFV